jgi:type III secretion protein J
VKTPSLAGRVARVVCGLLLTALCGCKEVLYSQLGENEAVEILGLLRSRGIDSSKAPAQEGLWSLSVESSQLPQAVEQLRAEGLPRERTIGMAELYKEKGMVSSPREEQARHLFALSEELSTTITRCIEGVLSARVHIVVPEVTPLLGRTAPSAASVVIKYRPEPDAPGQPPFEVSEIRSVIQNAVEGVAAERITVKCFEARPAHPVPPPPEPVSLALGRQYGPAAGAVVAVGLLALILWRVATPRRPGVPAPAQEATPLPSSAALSITPNEPLA